MSLDSIRSLLKEDLQAVDEFIISQLASHIPLIKEMIEYILSCGGKRIRPLVLLLSAQALSPVNKKYIGMAAVIELIHTATLLHDDVVDQSTLRRGHQTAHMIWGPEASVLIGDFLYSRAFQIVVDYKHDRILDIFAKATHYIAEGEILQLTNCHNPDTNESFYFDIIQRKTGKLFELASQLGAILSTKDEEAIEALRLYGMHLGLAYQLIDDALDYSHSAEQTGKDEGQDIADGKTTLPLIYAMQKANSDELKLIKHAIAEGETEDFTKIKQIIESTKAIAYTAERAKKEANAAKIAIKDLPASVYKDALFALADFVVDRNF